MISLTPTIFGIAWLAAKTGMFAGVGVGLIAGLQKLHDFQSSKKHVQPNPKQLRKFRGVDTNVRTSEDASEAFEKLRQLQES